MQESDLPALSAQVLWAAFFLALAFGAVVQRTHFCTMGAVADVVNMGSWARMRMWALAAGVAMVGFNAMVGAGWVQADKSIYASSRLIALSNALGGLLFGFGMVLGSGCGSKTLVRVGGGSLKALVVMLIMALSAELTMRGIVGVWRVATVDAVAVSLASSQDLPALAASVWGGTAGHWALALGGVLGGGLMVWSVWRPEGREAPVLWSGILVGLLVVGMWWVSGYWGHLSEHPQTLEEAFLATNSQRMESFTFVAPMAYTIDWLTFYSDRNTVLTVGVVATVGVIVGSAVMALLTRSFRWEGFSGTQDTALHVVGAVLMGIGGVTAMGCTVGQGLSGVSTLALGSFIAVAGIFAGAVAGLKFQWWLLERQA